MWILALMLSNVTIAMIETMNRQAAGNFLQQIWQTGPLILVAQFGLFIGFRDAPTMMMGWAVFTVGNSLVRLANVQFVVGEPLSLMTLVGVAVMIVGGMLVKVGSS